VWEQISFFPPSEPYLFPQAAADPVPRLYSIIKQEVNKLLDVGNNFIVAAEFLCAIELADKTHLAGLARLNILSSVV